MNTSILIRSYYKDIEWLRYAIRSIDKHCHGFHEIVIIVADYDYSHFHHFQNGRGPKQIPIRVEKYFGNRQKPMLNCMAQVCLADQFCQDADLILHTDSDCIFTKPNGPEDWIQDGKPILLVRTFASLEAEKSPACCWRGPTERALAMTVTHETMARHPAVHWKQLYPSFRGHIEHVHQKPFLQWAQEGPNVFPWPWAEFPALGFWAMKAMPDKYAFVDVSGMSEAQMEITWKDNLKQGWTHFDLSNEGGRKEAEAQRIRFQTLTR